MKKSVIVLFLIILVLMCSCKTEPEPDDEVGKVAGAGVLASTQMMTEYTEKGSYKGVAEVDTDNMICFYFSNATASVNLSELDASMGTHTITVSGEAVFNYESYPATYPFSVSYNIEFIFAGATHTLELKGRATGVSTRSFSLLKVDGKTYNPAILND